MNQTSRPKSRFRNGCGVLLVFFLTAGMTCAVSASQSMDQDLVFAKAKVLLGEGNTQAAYDMLIEYEVEWSGSDAYDYLLGVMALDSRHIGEAIFALQRLVVRRPEFSGARLELARAYFAAGENELARSEFLRLLHEDPPAKVRVTLDSYLDLIEEKARRYFASSRYFLGFGFGYDSNAPASTDEDQFLNFTLNDKNLEQSSSFGQVTLGGLWSRPLSPELKLVVNGSLLHRSNASAHHVDPSTANLQLGLEWERGLHHANIGGVVSALQLDRESNRFDYALSGNYMYEYSDVWRLNSSLQYTTLRYEDLLQIQDVDRLLFGLGLERMSRHSMFNLNLFGINDDERITGSNFGNDGFGLQLANTWFAAAGRRYFASLSVSNREYDQPFFTLDREDDLFSVTIGHSWTGLPVKNWDLEVQINYSERRSTVDLYEFDRWEAGLFLRRVFK